jgi:FlaA1/EpsC-like NDP-sugar epimerase
MPKNNFYKNKIILVTGGVGSIGSEIVKNLLKCNPKSIRVFDNNETGLFDLDQNLQSEKIRLLTGDVRDPRRLKRAMDGVDMVFHAAALKHVPLCEYNPFEAVQTNVIGTQNVIDACFEAGVSKMINISTDKAVNSINVMGATKLLTERLVAAAHHYKGKNKTVFLSVRFGNVLNSRGSIMPLFCRQIKEGGPVTVTNPDMIRFIMSIPKAVDLVLKSAEIAQGGEIFILKMPTVRIGDFADVMIEEMAPRYGHKPKEIKIKIIGHRNGEKFCEELLAENELKNASETEDMFVIPPYKDSEAGNVCFIGDNHSSKNLKFLTKEEIRKSLKEIMNFSDKLF